MEELELWSDEKGLRFRLINDIYAEVHFIDGSKELRLGENNIDSIFSKMMISFLPMQNRRYFSYEGEEMFVILNLMGPHASIAGRVKSQTERELVFLDRYGKKEKLMTLTPEIEAEWISKMCKFLVGVNQIR